MKYIFTLLAFFIIEKQVQSQLITPFSPVISVTQKGDITFAANSITTCTGTGANCTNSKTQVAPGGTVNNQSTGITIGYIDNDGNTGIGVQTFSSSSSTLDMGGVLGCGVIYAYLTWSGFVTTGTTNYAKRDSVYLQVPGGTVYNKLKADLLVDNTAPYNRTYHCYKDVTPLVKAAGPGVYTAGNIVAATGGNNQFAGWTLVVLYSDPNKSLKNLTIFRGLAGVSGTTSVQFNISGFFTPPAPAPVNVKLGIVGYDGDRAVPNAYNSGLPGDSLKFNGVAVNNGKNPASDIFNSTITNDNVDYTRAPAFLNTLGYDADLITLNNTTYTYLGNSASSATLRLSSGGETILTDIVTTAIDVFEPEMRFEKTFVNINGNNPAQLGDVIEYTLKVFNKGSDPADSLTVIDSLYGALNYVPGSMSIVNGPNAGAKSDDIGDDQMDYFATGNVIKARLGNGATGTTAGKLNNFAPDSVTTIRFRASITNDCTIFHCMDSVYNMAYATYYGQTSIQKRSTFSSANGIDPGTGCALTGPTALKVIVPACTLPADTTFVNCTPYNLSNLSAARPGYTTYYNSSWVQVTQATATGTYYALKSIYPSSYYLIPCYDTVQINFTGSCTLPVSLMNLSATHSNSIVNLRWSTSQEINSDHFEIERSVDGIAFTKTGFDVAAAGNSSDWRNYQQADDISGLLNHSVIYYRIKAVDKDGKTKYSSVVRVRITGTNQLSIVVSPNPVLDNKINVRITSPVVNRAEISIVNTAGQQVLKTEAALHKGENIVFLKNDFFASGIYILTVVAEGLRQTEKLIIH